MIGRVLQVSRRIVELRHQAVVAEEGGRALLLLADGPHFLAAVAGIGACARAARAIRADDSAEGLVHAE